MRTALDLALMAARAEPVAISRPSVGNPGSPRSARTAPSLRAHARPALS